jgi:hypothetical protein
MSNGFCGEIQGANRATNAEIATRTRPKTASLLSQKSETTRRNGVCGRTAMGSSAETVMAGGAPLQWRVFS